MEQEKTHTYNSALIRGVLFILMCAAACFLLLSVPIPRQIGLTFRNTLYVFPIVFITAFFCFFPRSPWVRTILKALLFAMLIAPYSGMVNSGLSDQYALGGFVPWSDAFTMQLNTQRFLYGSTMGQAAAIRPLSTVFYAVFLRIFGNNYLALYIVLAVLTALEIILAAEAVSALYGKTAAAMFASVLFFFVRKRLGTFMTEQYGMIWALLCCIFLLNGIRKKSKAEMCVGFLCLSFAQNARPAALFLFPFLGIWYFFGYLKGEKHRILHAGAALLAMLSGFAVNAYTQNIVYSGEKIPNRQAAEMIYGLALGGELWGNVTFMPEMAALQESDHMLRNLAALCIPVLKEHPENILKAVKTVYFDSLISSRYYGAFSFINGNPERLGTIIRYIMMILWTLGIILLWKERGHKENAFLLVCAGGVFSSVMAAVPNSSNYLRLYAASIWIPAVISGILLQHLTAAFAAPASQDPSPEAGEFAASLIGAILLIAAIISPRLLQNSPYRVNASLLEVQCPAGESRLITSIDRGSYIYLMEKADLQTEHYPTFRLPYVRQHFHDTASQEMFGFTDAISQPVSIIRGIDLETYQDALIFAPLQMVQYSEGQAAFCGTFIDPPILRNDRFFIPTSITLPEELK